MSLLHKLTRDTLQSRHRAWLTALVFAFMPFTTWLSVVLLGLVTLSKGALEGFWLLLLLLLSQYVWYLCFGGVSALVYSLISLVLFWLMAKALREYQHWGPVMQVAGISLAVTVFAIHVWQPNMQQWWLTVLVPFFQQMQSLGDANEHLLEIQKQLPALANIATGLQTVAVFLGAFWKLACARWLQAYMHDKKVLAKELTCLRLPVGLLLMLVFCTTGAVLDLTKTIELSALLDALPAVAMPVVIIGISLFNSLFVQNRLFLSVVFYVLFILFFIQVSALLIVLAVADSWLDLRNRWQSNIKR